MDKLRKTSTKPYSPTPHSDGQDLEAPNQKKKCSGCVTDLRNASDSSGFNFRVQGRLGLWFGICGLGLLQS